MSTTLDKEVRAAAGCLILVALGVVTFWLMGVALVATLPAWGAGGLSGVLVYGLIHLKLTADLRAPARLSRLITIDFDGVRLDAQVKREAVARYASRAGLVVVGMGGGVALGVLVWLLLQADGFGGETVWFQAVGVGVTAGLIALMIVLFRRYVDLAAVVETRLTRALDDANLSYESADDLQPLLDDIDALARDLQIDFPLEARDELRQYVADHAAVVFASPGVLRDAVAAQIARAKHDRTKLEDAARQFDEAMQLHREATPVVLDAGSPSMVAYLDTIYDELLRAKDLCLSTREWDLFNEAIAMGRQELDLLCKRAGAHQLGEVDQPEQGAEAAYRALGLNPEKADEITDDQIKMIYRKLAAAYHPDVGVGRDDAKFKEIVQAYEHLMNHRQA